MSSPIFAPKACYKSIFRDLRHDLIAELVLNSLVWFFDFFVNVKFKFVTYFI